MASGSNIRPVATTASGAAVLSSLIGASARLLGVQGATTEGRAVPSLQGSARFVRCVTDGGNGGGVGPPATGPTWTYTVTTLDGLVTLGTQMTPEVRRLAVVHEAQPPSVIGLGCDWYDQATQRWKFRLMWVDELPALQACADQFAPPPE